MAGLIVDLQSQGQVGLGGRLPGPTIPPQLATTTVTGATVDMRGTNEAVNAICQAGAFSGGTAPTVTWSFQESADTVTWTTVLNLSASVGQTPPVLTSTLQAAFVFFQRTQRYVRAVATLGGTVPPTNVYIACAVFAQLKMENDTGGFSLYPQT